MRKSTKVLFVCFNIVYFLFLYMLIPYAPRFIILGVVSSHFFFYLLAMVIASFVWGSYFKRYYALQDKKPPFENIDESMEGLR